MARMVASQEGRPLFRKIMQGWVFADAGYTRSSEAGIYKNARCSKWVCMLGLKMEHSTGSDFSSTENRGYCSSVDLWLKYDGEIIEVAVASKPAVLIFV